MATPIDGSSPNPTPAIQPDNQTPEPERKNDVNTSGDLNGRTFGEIKDISRGYSTAHKVKEFIFEKEPWTIASATTSTLVTGGALTAGTVALLAVSNPVGAIVLGTLAGFVASVSLPILLLIGVDYILRQNPDEAGRGPIPDDIDDKEKPKAAQPTVKVESEDPNDTDLSISTPEPEADIELIPVGSAPVAEGGAGKAAEPPPIPPRDILADQLKEQIEEDEVKGDRRKAEENSADSLLPSELVYGTTSENVAQHFNLGEGSKVGQGEQINGEPESRESLYSAQINDYIQIAKKNGSMASLIEAAKGLNTSIEGLLNILNEIVKVTDTHVEIDQKLRKDILSMAQPFKPAASRLIKQLNEKLDEIDKTHPYPEKLDNEDIREIKDRLKFLTENKIVDEEHALILFVNNRYLNRPISSK